MLFKTSGQYNMLNYNPRSTKSNSARRKIRYFTPTDDERFIAFYTFFYFPTFWKFLTFKNFFSNIRLCISYCTARQLPSTWTCWAAGRCRECPQWGPRRRLLFRWLTFAPPCAPHCRTTSDTIKYTQHHSLSGSDLAGGRPGAQLNCGSLDGRL